MFESMITAVWFALVLFQVVRARLPQISVLLVPVSAIALLLMGWSNSLSQEASPLSAALSNVWLFVHASFATAGAAAFLIAASYAAVYLVGAEKLANLRNVVPVMPDYPTLPRSMLNFLIFGLILWGVMIASGSIWAHSAWGRYWAWDPIEIWSLISWLLYGLVIHARLTFRLPQRAFCILTVAAAITVVFSLWGVQYVYETIHTYG
jgi:ABC-type transport system involved in cytochrome c biogenesis permease subunit